MDYEKQRKEYVEKHWSTDRTSDIAIHLNVSDKTVQNIARKLGLPPKSSKDRIFKQAHEALKEHTEAAGIPIEDVKHYWHKSEHFSLFVNNKQISLWEIKDWIIEEVQTYSPKYPKIDYPKYKEPHLLVVDAADVHIGKLASAFETGDAYDHEIAVKRVLEGVEGILRKSQGFDISQVLFVIGNDILHTDNAKGSTTSGTQQDTSVMWYDAFKIAQKLYVDVIETLASVAPLTIHYDPSNHDYVTGFLLAQTIQAWFRNCENITFNVTPSHRKYFVYGNNLIGTTHGDGAKESDLAMLMAHESKEWVNCKHRYFYTHHIHHKRSKDYMSVCVEALRSPSGTDSWHHRNGYTHSPKAIEGFIHHTTHGQVARITHLF